MIQYRLQEGSVAACQGDEVLWEVEIAPEAALTWWALSGQGTLLVGEGERAVHEVSVEEQRLLASYGCKTLEKRSPEARCLKGLAYLEPAERAALGESFGRLQRALEGGDVASALAAVLASLERLVECDPSVERAWASGTQVLARVEAGEDLHEWLRSWFQRLARLLLWPLG